MTRWIVLWTISLYSPKPCPEMPIDPYTGQRPPYVYAVMCGETETREMSKEFDTEQEAEKFIDDGPKDIHFRIAVVKEPKS